MPETTLTPALQADIRESNARAGRLSYYVAGDGPPLLLLHSINAAGSAFEVKPIFDHFRRSHTVYVPDLPGFGFSDRSDRRYTPQLYVDAIFDMLDVIAADQGGEQPIGSLVGGVLDGHPGVGAGDNAPESETHGGTHETHGMDTDSHGCSRKCGCRP